MAKPGREVQHVHYYFIDHSCQQGLHIATEAGKIVFLRTQEKEMVYGDILVWSIVLICAEHIFTYA